MRDSFRNDGGNSSPPSTNCTALRMSRERLTRALMGDTCMHELTFEGFWRSGAVALAPFLDGFFVGYFVPALGEVRWDDGTALGTFVSLRDGAPRLVLIK